MSQRRAMDADAEFRKHRVFLLIGAGVFVWSFVGHTDTFGWIMLSLPILLGAAATVATYRRFRFTTFVYALGLLYVIILMVGAKYTYTYNPLFDFIKDSLGHTRNFYDRVGHFAQGFIPVLVFKEILLRGGHMKRGPMFYLVLLAMVLAFSATWELLEFGAVLISGMDARYIMSLQGDMLDTQWDMFMALCGALTSLLLLDRYHDRKMTELNWGQAIL